MVRTQEAGILPNNSAIMTPAAGYAPAQPLSQTVNTAAPSITATTAASTNTAAPTTSVLQLQGQANDPKALQGSPTTGTVRLFINLRQKP